MKDFRKLKVWERAHKLTLSIYMLTKQFPKDELYGLTSQMRRSAFSIPTNIAEGRGRGSQAELSRFLFFAMGSSSELEYQIILSHDLHYIEDDKFVELSTELNEFRRMLNALILKVNHDKDVERLTANR
ncbi:MAG: four helix bundle protein [Chloroflexi bacterium RBG_13_48_10]|nr:MAG: four helix bundle protein [Chloroflexi bacterium RBG_13_48_10]